MNCFTCQHLPSADILLTEYDANRYYMAGQTLPGKVVIKTVEPISKKNLHLSFTTCIHETTNNVPTMSMPPIPVQHDKILYSRRITLSSLNTENMSSVSRQAMKLSFTRNTKLSLFL